MYYLDYDKIKQYLDGPFGGIEIACFFVENNKICVKISDNEIYESLCTKYKDCNKQIHKLKKDISNNSYYYLNYFDYDKIKDLKDVNKNINENVNVFCYFNGNIWICVSENNKKILDQLDAWYNSTHDVTQNVISITKEIETDFFYYC